MEYIDGMVGKVRIPDQFTHAAYANQAIYNRNDGGVEILFWHEETNIDGRLEPGPDGAVGEVVARIFMTDEQFARQPRVIQTLLEMWEEHDRR